MIRFRVCSFMSRSVCTSERFEGLRQPSQPAALPWDRASLREGIKPWFEDRCQDCVHLGPRVFTKKQQNVRSAYSRYRTNQSLRGYHSVGPGAEPHSAQAHVSRHDPMNQQRTSSRRLRKSRPNFSMTLRRWDRGRHRCDPTSPYFPSPSLPRGRKTEERTLGDFAPSFPIADARKSKLTEIILPASTRRCFFSTRNVPK